MGERFGLGNALQMQSSIHREMGRLEAARAASTEALHIFMDAGTLSGIAFSLGGLAALAIAEGDVEKGVRLGGAAEAIEEAIGGRAPVVLRGYPDARDIARPLIGEEATGRAWDEGQALSVDQATDLALEAPG